MKIKKALLDDVNVGSPLGRIICCAIYLNTKKDKIGPTVHEQVAQLTLKGNDTGSVARKTGFEESSVRAVLNDITAFCGAKE